MLIGGNLSEPHKLQLPRLFFVSKNAKPSPTQHLRSRKVRNKKDFALKTVKIFIMRITKSFLYKLYYHNCQTEHREYENLSHFEMKIFDLY